MIQTYHSIFGQTSIDADGDGLFEVNNPPVAQLAPRSYTEVADINDGIDRCPGPKKLTSLRRDRWQMPDEVKADCADNVVTEVTYARPGSVMRTVWSGQIGLLSSFICAPNLVVQDSPELRRDVKVKALAKMCRRELDLGIELGELGETMSLLLAPFRAFRTFHKTEPVRELAKLIRRYKNGPRMPLKDSQRLTDLFLMYQYGIEPMVGTIKAVVESLDSKYAALPVNKFLTARSNRSVVEDKRFTSVNDVGMGPTQHIATRHTKTNYRATVYYRITADLGPMQRYGLDIKQGVPLIWQLSGRSFVVDWFFNVTAWLQANVNSFVTEATATTTSARCSVKMHATQQYTSSSVKGQVVGPYSASREYYDRAVEPPIAPRPAFIGVHGMNLSKTVSLLALGWKPVTNFILKTFL